MRRSLLLVLLAACASSDRPPRTEVAIAPPVAVASTSSAPAVVAPPDAGAEDNDQVFDAMMNADKPPNNQSEEDALLIQMMTPTNVQHGPPVVHVDNDTTELGGQRAVIRRVLRQNAGRFRACYEKGLKTKPNLAGRVVARFRIESSGNVTQTESASGTTLPSPNVVACVVDAIKPLVFPQTRGGALIVDYPIVFAP